MCSFQAGTSACRFLLGRGGLGKGGSVQEALGPTEVNGLAESPGYSYSDGGLSGGGWG